MILLIHGFGSCGWGEKSLTLRRHFGVAEVLAPDLPFHPRRAIAHLRDIVARHPVRALVGSSLGGFYATCLNATEPRPTVLINPVVAPHELLADFTGRQRRWCDARPFVVTHDHLDALLQLQRASPDPEERYLVLLQQGDEVLDYRRAAAWYADKDLVVTAGGSHRFDDLEAQLPLISNWLAR